MSAWLRSRLAGSPLRNPQFARLMGALLVSQIGDQFTLIALIWFVLKLTGSEWLVGAAVLSYSLPRAISAPLWGNLMDRVPPQQVMLIDNAARAVIIALIPICYWLDIGGIEAVLGLALLAGLFSPATEIGARLLTQRMVPDQDLARANGMVATTLQLSILFGPALAGWTIARWNAPIAMLIDAASFLPLVAVLPTLKIAPAASAGNAEQAGQKERPRFTDGFKQVLRIKPVRVFTALLFTLALSYYPLEPALPLYVERVIRADADAFGTIWSAFGIGAALSYLLVAPLSHVKRAGVVAAGCAICWGIAILPMALYPSLPLALACFALGGLSWGPYGPLETTLLLRIIPKEQQGAVFGARSALINLTGPLGVMIGSALMQLVSPATVIAISSVAVLVAGAGALLSSDVRALRSGPTSELSPGDATA
jgi:MFS family permease